jgi:hypothetical protein
MADKKPPKPETKKEDKEGNKETQFVREAMKQYARGYDRERDNIIAAYDDLEFRAGNQWPSDVKQERDQDFRPTLTINRIPQFVRQVTGDIRMMRPSIKVVPVDSRGDQKTADIEAGMIRYIENRSDAQHAYTQGGDSQVACGIGHWRVLTEYADYSTFNQEIRIAGIDDGVAVVWDPDSVLPNREDAKFCFVPVDLSRAAFEERYPGKTVQDFEREASISTLSHYNEWHGDDFVRVAEYWEKRPEKRVLALLPDGTIDDLTDEEDLEYIASLKLQGARIEERDGECVYRSLITCAHELEPAVKWPGRFIPIVPVIGEEVKIGRKIVRHGVVRYAKDPQRMYNYFRSAQTEAVALQPKAPFIGTDKNFAAQRAEWESANRKNWPYLVYTPDHTNGNIPPQRSSPAVNTQGIDEGLLMSAEEMKAVVGIYDASLGNKSNETSGKAINARKAESDVGTFVYIDNFARAIRHTGRILLDLIPHVYDTERVIRTVGDDGKIDLVAINKEVVAGTTPNGDPIKQMLNDVTVGAYDVVLETGPSYATKREEAKEGMIAFLQSSPDVAPIVLDLIAGAMDWPNSDKIAKRLKTVLPPQIQAMEAEESGEPPPPQPEPQPDPEVVKAQAQIEMKAQETQANIALKQQESQANMAIKLEEMRQQHALEVEQMNHRFALETAQMNQKLLLMEREAQLRADIAAKTAERSENRKDFQVQNSSEG